MISIENLDTLYMGDGFETVDKIDMNTIRTVHHEIYEDEQLTAGDFRVLDIKFQGMKYKPPEWEAIPYHMLSFCDWYNTAGKGLHPIYFAAMAYFKIYQIQPFEFGNDEICSYIMNKILLQSGYITYQPKNKREFFTELNMAIDYADIWGFVDYVSIEMIKDGE